MIDLYAPYERRRVELVGDVAVLASQSVRAVTVRLSHPFFGETRSEQVVIRSNQPFEGEVVEITLPLGQFAYDYALTWIRADGSRVTSEGQDETGLIFVDEWPET